MALFGDKIKSSTCHPFYHCCADNGDRESRGLRYALVRYPQDVRKLGMEMKGSIDKARLYSQEPADLLCFFFLVELS